MITGQVTLPLYIASYFVMWLTIWSKHSVREVAEHDLGNRAVVGEREPSGEANDGSLVLTHDMETAVGIREMDLLRAAERAHGSRSSWNFVGARYQVDDGTVRSLQDKGCEIGVHGLWRDGRDLARRFIDKRLPVA